MGYIFIKKIYNIFHSVLGPLILNEDLKTFSSVKGLSLVVIKEDQ